MFSNRMHYKLLSNGKNVVNGLIEIGWRNSCCYSGKGLGCGFFVVLRQKMTEVEIYRELGALTKNKNAWEENIPCVASLLASESVKVKAKVLCLLGEMGLLYPQAIKDAVPKIVALCDSTESLLRERSIIALGRVGRGDYRLVEPFFANLFRMAKDSEAGVRLGFIWASENIATNTPDLYQDYMPLYAELLNDKDDKVRMEAPEMFRVIGKSRPHFVKPYLELLQHISGTDSNRVVRIHCLGAIKAVGGESFNEAFC